MKKVRREVGVNVAESQSSQGKPNRSVQEMALTNYIIVRQLICYLSYLDTANLCEASEDIMKMVGSKISYTVISFPEPQLSDPDFPMGGCDCEMFCANVEEHTIGYKRIYKIGLVELLAQLKQSRRKSFKLSLKIIIECSMEFIEREGEQIMSVLTEFGLQVEEFICYTIDGEFEYFQRCLQIFQNLRVLRYSYESLLEVPIRETFSVCLFNLKTMYLNVYICKARTDFLLSIAPNLQQIFNFPMDHINLITKYNAGTKVKTVLRYKNYTENEAFLGALINAGVKLDSPFRNFEEVMYEDIFGETNYPQKIFGPQIKGSNVKRIYLRSLKNNGNMNNVFPHITHVKLRSIEIKDLTTTLNQLNCMWPKLTSVTVNTFADHPQSFVERPKCGCCALSIDSVITGISDEKLKSISNNKAPGEGIDREGAGTSILFQMKNLRSLALYVPFCHFFSRGWGQKRNLTAASVHYTLKKLPNLKLYIFVDLRIAVHYCSDVYKSFEEFKQQFEPFSDHICVDTFNQG